MLMHDTKSAKLGQLKNYHLNLQMYFYSIFLKYISLRTSIVLVICSKCHNKSGKIGFRDRVPWVVFAIGNDIHSFPVMSDLIYK